MRIHKGRLLNHLIILGIIGGLFFGWFTIPTLPIGYISIGLPISNMVLLIILAAFFLFDCTIFGFHWAPLATFIISTLIFQNFALGIGIALLDYILLRILGRFVY